MRMDAYYYSFDKTGIDAIDKILSAVACAGKSSHHTSEWGDDVEANFESHSGNSPVGWIQNAANEAAKQFAEKQFETAPEREPVNREEQEI